MADLNKCLSLDATIDWGLYSNRQANHYLNRSYCYYYLGDNINAKKDSETAVSMGTTLPDEFKKTIGLKS